jgi:hypothetical protein
MTLALTLLRAAHARGSHHHLALDALIDLPRADGEAWRRLMHAHIANYCDGAKAPDTAFKDFQNHVLHVRDGFWGGAPQQAGVWYGELVSALKRQEWSLAAYNAGVLSHYVTDPLMPLHTAQSDAENAVHAAIEWTVSRSYADLRALGLSRADLAPVPRPTGEAWLRDLIRSGAERATQHYETLLTHYDINSGVVVPEEGFDAVGRRAVAEMVIVAARTFGVVFDRALTEAAVTPPAVDLTRATLAAIAALPKAWWEKRQVEKGTRALIEAQYDELMATGRVEATLTEDEKCIRALFAKEQGGMTPVAATAAPRSAPAAVRAPRSFPATPAATADPASSGAPGPAGAVEALPAATTAAGGALAAALAATFAAPVRALEPAPAPEARPEPSPAPAPALPPSATTTGPVEIPSSLAATPVLAAYRPSPSRDGGARLAPDSPIVDAPSIGPKTAKRLNDVGIDTVADFMAAHPIALAARLEAAHITADVLTEWQDQTRLMLTLPILRATHAQLLTGSGYRTVAAIASVEPDQLGADILHFALSTAGQRVLRQGDPPEVEQIRAWAEQARALKAA